MKKFIIAYLDLNDWVRDIQQLLVVSDSGINALTTFLNQKWELDRLPKEEKQELVSAWTTVDNIKSSCFDADCYISIFELDGN